MTLLNDHNYQNALVNEMIHWSVLKSRIEHLKQETEKIRVLLREEIARLKL